MTDWTDPLLGSSIDSQLPDDNSWTDPVLGAPIPANTTPRPVASSPNKDDDVGPIRAGFAGRTADVMTLGAKIAQGLGMPETAADLESGAQSRYETEAKFKPLQWQDVHGVSDLGQYLYEGTAANLPYLGAGLVGAAAAPAAGVLGATAAGTAAFAPMFVGSELKSQMDQGKSLGETSLGKAALAGIPEAAVAGPLLALLPAIPGGGAASPMIVRAAIRGLEGGAIGGVSNAAISAIHEAVNDPTKLFSADPQVQEEIKQAAIAGGLFGGILGGAHGALVKGKPNIPGEVPRLPQEGIGGEQPLIPESPGVGLPPGAEPPAPPEQTYYPNRTGLPGPYEPNPGVMFPEGTSPQPESFQPNGTGLPGPREPAQPFQPDTGVMFPPGSDYPYTANKTGLPRPLENEPPFQPNRDVMVPEGPATQYTPDQTGLPQPVEPWFNKPTPQGPPFQPDRSVMFPEGPVEKVAPPKNVSPGQAVYKDVQQQLLGAGVKPLVANNAAKLWRAHYETNAPRLGTDAYSLYKQYPIEVVGEGSKTKVQGPSYDQTVYHGTPNPTPFDRFNSQYISTGEGGGVPGMGQAFGYGHYFTENKWLAAGRYRDELARQRATADFNGHPLEEVNNSTVSIGDKLYTGTDANYLREIKQNKGDYETLAKTYEGYAQNGGTNPTARAEALADAQRIRELGKETGAKMLSQKGRLYTVDVPDEGFLHWDKPLEEQANYRPMMDKIERGLNSDPTVPASNKTRFMSFFDPKMTGEDLYQNLSSALGSDRKASMFLADKADLYGHKFYEGRSRQQGRQADLAKARLPELQQNLDYHQQSLKNAKSDLRQTKSLERKSHINKTIGYHNAMVDKLKTDIGRAKSLSEFKPLHNYVVYRDETPRILKYEQGERGKITLGNDRAVIRLMDKSDASTFMHESAHFFLENMREWAKTSPEIAQDLASAMKWMGVDKPGDIKTLHHEQFARGFEQYLREGKAPTKGLQGVFDRFKEWLRGIYQKASDLNVKLNPEIRNVYDRLFSEKEPLEQAREADRLNQKPGRMPALDRDTFSQGARTFNQDEVGKRGDAVDAMAKSGRSIISRATDRAIKIGKGIYYLDKTTDPFGHVPKERELTTQRQLAFGKFMEAEAEGKAPFDIWKGANAEDQKAGYKYLTTPNAPASMVPAKYRMATVRGKELLYKYGQELVRRGMLPEDTFQANAGKYLPNVYLKYLLEHEGITGAGMKANLSEIKARKNLTAEEQVALGKVEHPGILLKIALTRNARDIAALDYLNNLGKESQWVHPKSFTKWNGQKVTPEWMSHEADLIRNKLAPAMERTGDTQRAHEMRSTAQKMTDHANEVLSSQGDEPHDPKDWKQLPNTSQYGMLRGAWVRKAIADDITGMTDFTRDQSTMAKLFGDKNSWLTRATYLWKSAKVPWSPSAQARNFGGNTIQANLFGGIPFHRMIPTMIAAAKDIKANGQYWQLAKKYGLPHSTMAETEIHALADKLGSGLHANDTGALGIMKAMSLLRQANEKVTNLYQTSEAFFKTMVMMDGMKRGLSEEAAARLADDAIYDYTRVGPSVKYARNMPLGMPFITWQYKTIPMLVRTMRENPMRFLPYVAFMAGVPMAVSQITGLKGDDPERLRMALNNGLRRQNNMYLLPFKDANGKWQFADIGYFFPWQMPQDVIGGIAKGNYGDAYKALNLFSSPIVNVIQAMNTGIDPFTGNPIADKRDPVEKQIRDITGYVWSLAMPSFIANYGAAGKAMEKLEGTGINRNGEPTSTWGQIAARALGVNVYPVAPEAQRARNINQMNNEIQQIRSRMTYSLKDRSLTPEDRRALVNQFQNKIRERQQDLREYVQKSAMTPSLRAASATP